MKKILPWITLLFLIGLNLGGGKALSQNAALAPMLLELFREPIDQDKLDKLIFAAEQGDGLAQGTLAPMYYMGSRAPQDYKAAMKWAKLAGAQGLAAPCQIIATMYHFGQGVPKNNIYAYMWLTIAENYRAIITEANGRVHSDFNHPISMRLEKEMTLDQISTAKQLANECISKNYKDC